MNVNAAGQDLGYQIDIAVAKKSFDQARKQGDAMVSLMKDAASVGRAARGAVSPVAGPQEAGSGFDVTG